MTYTFLTRSASLTRGANFLHYGGGIAGQIVVFFREAKRLPYKSFRRGRVSRPVCKLTLNGADGETLGEVLLEEGEYRQHRTGCDDTHCVLQSLRRQ